MADFSGTERLTEGRAHVTTPAGTPATPQGPGDEPPAAGGEGGTGAPAAQPARRRRWPRVLALGIAVLVLAGAGTVWYAYKTLDDNITTDTRTQSALERVEGSRPAHGPTHAENILLIGSDTRGNGNGAYGEDSGTQRSDTTILLHLAADRSSATAVSIPRDLMAHVPGCAQPDGTMTEEKFVQFNWAFEFGGAACTIRTVEQMTGIRIDHHLIVDFTGFKRMIDAVDGVEVCIPTPIHDKEAHLDLPAGRQKLMGEQALGFVRARYSLGDGSDTMRMERQQEFLGALVRKIRSKGVLLNPAKLYPLLSAATSALTADPGLDTLADLDGLAQSLDRTPSQAVRFLTVPRKPYTYDTNRDELVQPAADQLFAALRADQPVNVAPGSADDGTGTGTAAAGTAGGPSATAVPTAAPTPAPTPTATATATATYRGTTADQDVCGKAQ